MSLFNHSRKLLKLLGITVWLCLISLCAFTVSAQETIMKVRGEVRDSLTHTPIPYSAVFLTGTQRGILTDENGKFEIITAKPFTAIQVSVMGYDTKTIPVSKWHNGKKITIDLVPTGVKLKEIVIKPGKEKYSKKNNPAVDFATRIRKLGDSTDPKRNDYYSYDKYERITLALNNFDPRSDKNLILKNMKFLKDYVDTSEVSGRPILNISTREKSSTVYYRKNPQNEKEYIEGLEMKGLDDFMDNDNMLTLFEDVLREIDLYQGQIPLFRNHFVSPLSSIAPDFYKFYLTDTIEVDSITCVELSFVPRNSESMGFVGRVYVPVGDTTMFVKKVIMNVPHDINLNFIEKMYIEQVFDKAPDGSRLKLRDDLVAEISIMRGVQGLYMRRNTAYANHTFNEPQNSESLFSPLGRTVELDSAYMRSSDYWAEHRIIPISHTENHVDDLAQRIRSFKFYRIAEGFVRYMVTGYIPTGKNSKFDIGPLNSVISHNFVEGWRPKIGGLTTANLSKRIFARGYVAYGTKDKVWKYSGEVEYSFHDKKYHSREFPVHALRLSHLYDVDMIGQHFAFAQADNMFLSFKRHDDKQITYHRQTKLDYILELRNNFSVTASLIHERQEATQYMPFIDGRGKNLGHYQEAMLKLQLRYAPGEKFYQHKSTRKNINHDAPIFMLTHTYAPKGILGNNFGVNVTEVSVQKRFWLSFMGYADLIVKGGHVWSKSAYPNLLIPTANLSYTIQPEAFSLMNPMEFVNDTYASWDLTYNANGALLNRLPLIKKLQLREVFAFRGLWGHLSKRNNPEYNMDLFRFPADAYTVPMTNMPYMEVSVGVENIFKVLRVDYVWRLSYRSNFNADRSGPRIALHFTF